MTVGDAKTHIKRMMHGASETSIGDLELIMQRAANTIQSKIDLFETIRTAPLTNTIHDDVYNYGVFSDMKDLIDLYPQDYRYESDKAGRRGVEDFDLRKAIRNKTVSIESSEGTKTIRINWRSRQGKVLHNMNSLTSNGAWSAVASATGLQANTIFKVSGSASIEFDVVASGDGISNTTMTAIDMTDEDEVADIFVWMYFGTVSALTSVSARWGNDITANYWSSTAQTTQADGSAFKAGWNLIKFSWSTATETGTVNPATIDSFRLTVASTGAIANVRVDNIIFSIGRNFEAKYYSKYLFKNSSGTWIAKPTSDSDTIVCDTESEQIFLLECLIASAQQQQGAKKSPDVTWAREELGDPNIGTGLYGNYVEKYPSQIKKTRSTYYSI